MRIGIVSPEFPPDLGGVETYAFQFARELAGRGVEVTVFTKRHPQGEITEPRFAVKPILALRRALDAPLLAREAVDAWHAMNAGYAWLALDMAQPVVVSVHGNDFLRPYYPVAQPDFSRTPVLWRSASRLEGVMATVGKVLTPRLMRQALRRASRIIVNSRYTEGVFLERYPECRGLTSVGLVGVATDFFEIERLFAADRIPRLLTVSRLSEPRKNVGLVLRVLASLKDRYAFRYTVVGDGRERAELERLGRELGLAERVRFAGAVSAQELKQHFAEADLFVLAASIIPGSHEGFGIVYLEAAASGVPSLAVRLAGAAEAVAEGVSGVFVEEPTIPALAAALEAWLSGRVRFSAEACRKFAHGFSWAKVVDCALPYYSGSTRCAPARSATA